MRFMVIVKATAETEAGVMPTAEDLARMGAYNQALIAAGVMIDGAGLRDSSKAARVLFDGEEPMVVDGPFTETKELMAGYWIWECPTMADAIAWLKKAPFDKGVLELRQLIQPEDLAGVATDQAIAEEKAHREKMAAQATMRSNGRSKGLAES